MKDIIFYINNQGDLCTMNINDKIEHLVSGVKAYCVALGKSYLIFT